MIIFLSILNPKRKNAIVYTNSILTFNAFIPWNNIQGSMHSISFVITIPFIITNGIAPIKVSSSQVSLINELFKSNNIDSINY